MTKEEFTNLIESDRGSAVSTLASLILLTPNASWLYENAGDQDVVYKETARSLIEKPNSELLEEAIKLGITE